MFCHLALTRILFAHIYLYLFINVNHIAGHPLRLVRSSMESRHTLLSQIGPRVVFYVRSFVSWHIFVMIFVILDWSFEWWQSKILINFAGRKPKTSKKSEWFTIYIQYTYTMHRVGYIFCSPYIQLIWFLICFGILCARR